MRNLTRRDLAGLSLGSLAALSVPKPVHAAMACVAGNIQPFVPTSLHVDCASHANFRLFRQYSTYMGLAGVVCMNGCSGKYGAYAAGSLMLYPWLKTNAKALRNSSLKASVPTGTSLQVLARPIPNPFLPQDEYFCRIVLQAPYQNFIGVLVDTPLSPNLPRASWYTEVPKLSDGGPAGVEWTSANLNERWFGGSHDVPADATCSGSTWRALIIDGLNQAAAAAC